MLRGIYVLWSRQLIRYFRSKERIIGALGQPLLLLIAFGFGFGPIFQKAGQGNYIIFLTPGVIALTVMFSSVFFGAEVIADKDFGFLKETLVAPVPRSAIMIGRSLGGSTVSTIQGILVLLLSFLFGFRLLDYRGILLAVVFMFLTALLFTALGTAIGSALEDMQAFQLIVNFIVMPLFFLSGSIFPLAGLPPLLSTVAALDPLSYGIDGLRGSLTGSYHFGLGLDLAVLGGVAVIIVLIGTRLFSRLQI